MSPETAQLLAISADIRNVLRKEVTLARLPVHQMIRLQATSLPLVDAFTHFHDDAVTNGTKGAKLVTYPHWDKGRLRIDGHTSPRGLQYYIAQLGSEDVSAMTKLQEEVRSELVAAGQPTFTIAKTEQQFRELLESGAIILGMFDSATDALIGQSMISIHHDSVPAIPQFFTHSGTIFIRQGTLVRRTYRGHRLNERMLKVQKAVVGLEDMIVVEIDASNIFNLRGLMASGFVLYDAYIDPKNDGQALALTTLPSSRIPEFLAPVRYASSFDGIRTLLGQGYYGIHLRDNEIGFSRAGDPGDAEEQGSEIMKSKGKTRES